MMDVGIWENVCKTEERHKDGHILYTANCKFCGLKTKRKLSDLKRNTVCNHRKTGIKDKRIGDIYNGMIYRCYNEKNKSFQYYGAKGIRICADWLNEPHRFELWAITNGYQDTLTIDRIDPNKDYCPENCRWISKSDNSKYKSTTNLIEIDGERKTPAEWGNTLKIGKNRIRKYISRYGYDNTVTFIKLSLKYGIPNPDKNQSYYDLVMKYHDMIR